ncbi:wax ester/triacylglycerol synthase domain-containing protein [Streptomyces sp. Ac-502]|uniref:wax ester/triacylglycerol synthase domain-containing protein n=1 Tax=Streptomyces sp. Ac-502 TaxID=3342801 RepID=UPI0038627ED4
MAPLDQLMWKLQCDAPHQATVTVLAYLEPPADLARLTSWHEKLIRDYPRLTHRVGGSAHRPYWETDPHFALEDHLVHIGLGKEAGEKAFSRLLHSLVNTSFPADRAPWQAYLIDGVQGGDGVLYILKISHALADGLQIAGLLNGRIKAGGPPPSKHVPDPRGGLRRDRVTLWRQWGTTLLLPARPRKRAPAPSRARRYAFFTADLEPMQRTAKITGGTVNDVLLCAIARATGRYLAVRDATGPSAFRALSLVALRRPRAPHAANHFTLASITVPAQQTETTAALRAVRAAVTAAGGPQPADILSLAAKAARYLPAPLLISGIKHLGRRHDFMATNVPVGKDPITIGGRRVQALFGVAPLAGTPVITTFVSYRGTCHISLNADPAAITDLPAFTDQLRTALHEITAETPARGSTQGGPRR